MMIKLSPEISNRTDFSLLCNARGLTGVAVEVGTDRGEFAVDFMRRWNGRELLCMDPYEPYEEMMHTRECDKMMAVLALQPFWPRVRICEIASPAAVKCVQPWHLPLDFVYIDGSHLFENVAVDLKAWWPLVGPAGILAGHDFDATHPGVMKAVEDFASKIGASVYLTHEDLSSWYIYKTQPSKFIRRLFIEDEVEL